MLVFSFFFRSGSGRLIVKWLRRSVRIRRLGKYDASICALCYLWRGEDRGPTSLDINMESSIWNILRHVLKKGRNARCIDGVKVYEWFRVSCACFVANACHPYTGVHGDKKHHNVFSIGMPRSWFSCVYHTRKCWVHWGRIVPSCKLVFICSFLRLVRETQGFWPLEQVTQQMGDERMDRSSPPAQNRS